MSPDVGFFEVRLFDLNLVIDIGIAPEQSTFADVFLLMCLFRDSPPISSREQPFRPLAHELFDDMQPFAEMLDTAYGGRAYAPTLQRVRNRIDHPDTTPSAQILEANRDDGGYFNCALQLSRQHHDQLLAQPLDATTQATFKASAAESLVEQHRLEALPKERFEDYVARYYA